MMTDSPEYPSEPVEIDEPGVPVEPSPSAVEPEQPAHGIDPLMLAQSVLMESLAILAKQVMPKPADKIAFGHAWATFSLAQATWQQCQLMSVQLQMAQRQLALIEANTKPADGGPVEPSVADRLLVPAHVAQARNAGA